MQTPLSFATHLAQETGSLLLEYYRQAGIQATLKADRSVVTAADLAADKYISEQISAAFPGDGLLSEELKPAAPNRVEGIWVIDPLDGTTNFSLGFAIWGVSIARLVDGWPSVAAIYFPLIHELYTAAKGEGAFLNGDPIRVRPYQEGQPAAFFACCSRTHRRYNIRIPYKPRILGSAAYNLCAVARGAALLSFEATPKIWDIAGGWLIVQEAGGVLETRDGSTPFPVVAGADYSKSSFPLITAATPDLAAQAREQITPRKKKSAPR